MVFAPPSSFSLFRPSSSLYLSRLSLSFFFFVPRTAPFLFLFLTTLNTDRHPLLLLLPPSSTQHPAPSTSPSSTTSTTMHHVIVLLHAVHTLATPYVGGGAATDPVVKNLLLPPWPPTYNLSQSTMTQSCFGPARIGAAAPLTNASGQFMKHWGIITLDFESQETIWGHHSPKDSDTMMLAQAAQMKEIAPDTKIWVYRNLAQASVTSSPPSLPPSPSLPLSYSL